VERLAILTAFATLLVGCLGTSAPAGTQEPGGSPGSEASPAALEPLRYVALGDSYTIGTGLPRQVDRWPKQLERALRPELRLRLVDNLAVSGNTTYEVIDEQLAVLEELAPDFVSLLVGVNDVIRNVTEDEYRANLELILDGRDAGDGIPPVAGVLDLVPADRVLLVTTPDYTLTPRGGGFGDPVARAATIDRFNAILKDVAAARGIAVVDIAPISDLVPQDPTLVADDDLHPSAKQYAGWVELIAPTVRRLLEGSEGTRPPSPGPMSRSVG
jgi:acyl-CoA thioesterase I